MHPHQIAFTTSVELQDLLVIGCGFFCAHQVGYQLRTRAQHLAYGAPRKLHSPGNATDTMPLLLELQNRSSRALIQHRPSPGESVRPSVASRAEIDLDNGPTPDVRDRQVCATLPAAIADPRGVRRN